VPDDIKAVTIPAISHRLITRGNGVSRESTTAIVRDILEEVAVP
jgi:MoxR-like ATPase